jgi:hypothetical protein
MTSWTTAMFDSKESSLMTRVTHCSSGNLEDKGDKMLVKASDACD